MGKSVDKHVSRADTQSCNLCASPVNAWPQLIAASAHLLLLSGGSGGPGGILKVFGLRLGGTKFNPGAGGNSFG